jgi:MFS family permease
MTHGQQEATNHHSNHVGGVNLKRRHIHPAWITMGITFATLFMTAGYRSAPSVLILPLHKNFGWSTSTISLAISINVLLFGLTAPFAAALMERFGIKRVVMSALTTIGTGAFLTIFMKHPWQLDVLWGVVVGIGSGSMALVFAATIANRWFVSHKGIVLGALTAATATGQLIFLPGLTALATQISWKAVSIAVSSGAFLMVPLIALFLKESPSIINHRPLGAPEDWVEPITLKKGAGKFAITTLKMGVKKKDFWILVGSFMVCGLSTNGLIGTHFIPAAHDHGLSAGTAASLLAMVGVFDVIGTILSGHLTDKIDPRKLLFFYYFFRGLSLFLLPSILFATIHLTTLVFIVFYGLDWVATVPPTVVLCRRVLNVERGSVVYGWVFAAHQIGGSIAAFGAAVIRNNTGAYSLAFYIAGILCIIAAAAVLGITPAEKK